MSAKKKNKEASDSQLAEAPPQAALFNRLVNVLALLMTKGETRHQSVVLLSAAGFKNKEIASLLTMTENAVGLALFKARKEA